MTNELIEIRRKVYNYAQFRDEFPETSPFTFRFAFFEFLWEYYQNHMAFSGHCLKLSLLNRFPFLQIINEYKQDYFMHDFITGIEVILVGILLNRQIDNTVMPFGQEISSKHEFLEIGLHVIFNVT